MPNYPVDQMLMSWLGTYFSDNPQASPNSVANKINSNAAAYGLDRERDIGPKTIREFRTNGRASDETRKAITAFLAREAAFSQPDPPMISTPIDLGGFFATKKSEFGRTKNIEGTYQTWAHSLTLGKLRRGLAIFAVNGNQYEIELHQKVDTLLEDADEVRQWAGFATPKGAVIFAVLHTCREEASATPLFAMFERRSPSSLWGHTLAWCPGEHPRERLDRTAFLMEKCDS